MLSKLPYTGVLKGKGAGKKRRDKAVRDRRCIMAKKRKSAADATEPEPEPAVTESVTSRDAIDPSLASLFDKSVSC